MTDEGTAYSSLESIDRSLRDAKIKHAILNLVLYKILNYELLGREDSMELMRKIEENCSKLFSEFLWDLYAVLDQCYYYLYCHFQNRGCMSFGNKAFQIKTPVKQKLKWCNDHGEMDENRKRDNKPECAGSRECFLNDQCKAILGDKYWEKIPENKLNWFKANILSMQTVCEVDRSGCIVKACPLHGQECQLPQCDKGAKLVYFDVSNKTFADLPSVSNEPWNDTTAFNLLHFLRNFSLHRALLHCYAQNGFLNKVTQKFKAKSGHSEDTGWLRIFRGLWIRVPELSHLRDNERGEREPQFHSKPLQVVCSLLLNFVDKQRSELLSLPSKCQSPNQAVISPKKPIDVSWSTDRDSIDVKRDDQVIEHFVFQHWDDGRWAIIPEIQTQEQTSSAPL